MAMSLRRVLRVLGVFICLPLLALTALAAVTPGTASGAAYLLGSWLLAAGLIAAPRFKIGSVAATVLGVLVLACVAGVRIHAVRTHTSRTTLVVLPDARTSRWIDRLVDERDLVLFGERALRLVGGVSEREHEGVVNALSAEYARGLGEDGALPSPVPSAWLGLDAPSGFDAVVVQPALPRPDPPGIVFLHGFAGNVALQCREIARAVERVDAITVCPSTGWSGAWWRPDGAATVRASLRYLRERGIGRVYLGGYSNGGVGVGRLIPALRSEKELRGLFFVAGTAAASDVRASALPVLVVQGREDERMPVEAARRFALDVGALATYAEVDADHFLIVKRPAVVEDALGSWLERQESSR